MKSIFAAAASLTFLASVNGANVVELAQSQDSLKTLVDLVVANDLADTLSTASPITVFAPTNEAFTEYLSKFEEGSPSLECQAEILKLHVLTSKADQAALLADPLPLASLSGANLWSLDQFDLNATDVGADQTGDDNNDSLVHIVNKVLDGSIATTATYAGGLDTLVAAVVGAELLGGGADKTGVRLDDPCDTYTVFAPTDAAFAAVKSVTDFILPETVVSDNYLQGLLRSLLTYHVLPNKVVASDVQALQGDTALTTANGEDITANPGLTINGKGITAVNDVLAGLGVVHVVDGVLVPPSFPTETIAEFVVSPAASDFATLVSYLSKFPDLLDAVSNPATNSWTVFAPTNQAFTNFLVLNPNPSDDDLKKVLQAHIVNTAVLKSEIGSEFTTIGGATIPTSSVKLLTTDIKKLNGVIHVVERVIDPNAGSAPSASSTMQTSMVLACAALLGKAFY